MKSSGLFLNMAKWCVFGFFFGGFNVIVVCFGVFGIVPEVLRRGDRDRGKEYPTTEGHAGR